MNCPRSNTGIVGSSPTQDMGICLRLFCVCVGSGLVTGWYLVQGVLPTVLGLRNWSGTKYSMDALCSKMGGTVKREIAQLNIPLTNKRNLIGILNITWWYFFAWRRFIWRELSYESLLQTYRVGTRDSAAILQSFTARASQRKDICIIRKGGFQGSQQRNKKYLYGDFRRC
jgi:hypothetical protein